LVPAADGQVPTSVDSVVGEGRVGPFGPDAVVQAFGVQATSGPAGEDPRGSVGLELTLRGITLQVGGPVRCLSVSGNQAVVGFEPSLLAPGALIEVVDNGPPGSGTPDLFIAYALLEPVDASSCVLSDFPRQPLVEGDLTVTDATAPTSKEQCERRGWRSFPGFKNQGQCVAFVQRGPR
jgi:hypothetical protein